jgi:hypothetical protein
VNLSHLSLAILGYFFFLKADIIVKFADVIFSSSRLRVVSLFAGDKFNLRIYTFSLKGPYWPAYNVSVFGENVSLKYFVVNGPSI